MTWLLANWKLVGIGLLIAALGVQAYRLQDLREEYDYFRLEVEAAGREAKAKAEAIDAHNDLVKEEMEHDIHQQREERARERAARSDRFAALYDRHMGLLNADPGGGRVSEAAGSPAQPVHDSSRICFDRTKLVSGLRDSLGAFDAELEPLLKRGEDGLDHAQFWGRWARLVGACSQ